MFSMTDYPSGCLESQSNDKTKLEIQIRSHWHEHCGILFGRISSMMDCPNISSLISGNSPAGHCSYISLSKLVGATASCISVPSHKWKNRRENMWMEPGWKETQFLLQTPLFDFEPLLGSVSDLKSCQTSALGTNPSRHPTSFASLAYSPETLRKPHQFHLSLQGWVSQCRTGRFSAEISVNFPTKDLNPNYVWEKNISHVMIIIQIELLLCHD